LIKNRIEKLVPENSPLVIAGDFNDWRRHASNALVESMKVSEVFETTSGRPARSFPAILPMLHLDRIYVRGFSVELARAHHGHSWSRVSDHIALSARLIRKL